MENAFTPTITMAMYQTDDVPLRHGQIIRSSSLIIIQRHHCSHRRTAVRHTLQPVGGEEGEGGEEDAEEKEGEEE